MSNTLNLGTDGNWATKDGSLLGYNNENNNYKPLPFDFTRDTVATVVNKQGLIETVGSGEPRIDFSNDAKGALLLEPQRMNKVTYSEDFSNSAWNTSSTRSVDFIPTSTIDPQGKTNAYRITSTASDNQVAFLGSIVSGQSYASSIYVRRVSGSGNVILRNVNNGENNFQVSVNDGWKRIETSATSTSTNGRLYINLVTVGDVIEIWGSQLEQGSYATSYIPTQGSAVTRSADACNNGANEQVINSTEGVLYAEGQSFGGTSNGFITLSDGSGTNRISLRIGYYISTLIYIQMTSSGEPQFEVNYNTNGTSFNFNDFNKYALKYKQNDCALFLNGIKVISISSATMPTNLSKFQFTNSDGVGLPFLGTQKDVRLYNTALTDSELQALTKI